MLRKYSISSPQSRAISFDFSYNSAVTVSAFSLSLLTIASASRSRYSLPDIPAASSTARSSISLPEAAQTSSNDKASRIAPSDNLAIIKAASLVIEMLSFSEISVNLSAISSAAIRPKSNRWQRESMVAGNLCTSVVARIKTTWAGGSSKVLSKALNAAPESM